MKLTYLVAGAIASLAASPVIAVPTISSAPIFDAGMFLTRNTVGQMKYENLNHLIIRMTDAVEQLDGAISKAISSKKIEDSLAPAEKGLGLVSMFLQDATDGLKNGSITINNPKQVYGSLGKLKDAIKPVADKTASLKIQFDQMNFTGVIVTVLQSLTVAFDGFYHALDTRLDKSEVPDCIALPILNMICTLDGAIYTLDSTAALTDDAFCTTPDNNQCPSWQELPKKLPGMEKAHWDVRWWLFLVYQNHCHQQKCKWELIEIIFIEKWTWCPGWVSDKKKQQKRLN